jgi:hypothetical protein
VTDQPLTEDQQLLMLHEVPGNLSGEQSAGQVCVWCLTPYGPLADLGGVGDWRWTVCTPIGPGSSTPSSAAGAAPSCAVRGRSWRSATVRPGIMLGRFRTPGA